MNKDQIIGYIQACIDQGSLTPLDLAELARKNGMPMPTAAPVPASAPAAAVEAAPKSAKHGISMIQVLYSVGAVIILAGVGILVGQHWDEIGFGGRLFVSLGISFIAYVIGIFLGRDRTKSLLSQVMFIVATALAPLGIYVILQQQGIVFDAMTQFYAAIALLIVFSAAQAIVRNNINVIIIVLQATWAYFAILGHIFASLYGSTFDWIQWSVIVLGIAYLCTARWHELRMSDASRESESITNLLNSAGSLAILGAGISLGGAWDFIYILVVFGAFYGSVLLKSRSMLFYASIFLIADIIKITSKYFVSSVGWPLALIVCGVVIIAVAWGALRINKVYLKKAL
jgi:hypothetical protein